MGSPGRRTTPGDDDLWQQCRAKVFLGVVSTLVADALWFIAQHPQKSAYWPMPLLSRHAVLCLIIPMRGARLLICSRPRLLPWNLQVRTAKQLGYLVRNLIIAPPLWAVSLRSRLDRRRGGSVCIRVRCGFTPYPSTLRSGAWTVGRNHLLGILSGLWVERGRWPPGLVTWPPPPHLRPATTAEQPDSSETLLTSVALRLRICRGTWPVPRLFDFFPLLRQAAHFGHPKR